ncbi:hypothetical protein EW145_g2149 [Phellinidium pouzarii]|uniref:Uncharacterized protein n=1 Tax=Phellinidium pouzarii TaxID=167371 RepID=A0A4S4LDN3_9AGAM|nr:hypothetical protein EW145_g2149 [Phellinidium pouzarii]
MDSLTQVVNTNANATHLSLKTSLAPSVSNFEERVKHSTHADKTALIEAFRVLKEQYPTHLALRSRRCGKTTMLTMFQSFFEKADPKTVEERRKLYENTPLVISKSSMVETYFAQHPMKQHFDNIVIAEFERHEEMGHFKDLDKRSEASLKRVLEGLEAHRCQAFYVLAKILKKDNLLDVHGAIMAGIIRIEQTGFLSGLNNLLTFSLDSPISTPLERAYSIAFLFTIEEVETIFIHYAQRNYPFTIRDLREWYGGYCTTEGHELFNPWSICRALETCSLRSFWTASGIDNILLRRISTSRDDFQKSLGFLLGGRGVLKPSQSCRVGIADDMTKDELLNVLHYTGYLTGKVTLDFISVWFCLIDLASAQDNLLRIPNRELQGNFFFMGIEHND